MQNYVSCEDSHHRAYLYNFYGSIFNDPSVTIDGEAYSEFCDLMDKEMDYAARKGLRTPEDIYYDENFNHSYALLQNSFSIIGVDVVLNGTTDLTFTLPSGEKRVLDELQGTWASQLTFNCQNRMTDEYFSQSYTFWELEHEEIKDLRRVGCQAAGTGTRWLYDDAEKTLEIQGEGSLANFALWAKLNITEVNTLILGAGVRKLEYYCFNNDMTIVDLHGELDPIQIDNNISSNYGLFVIYSDNQALRNANWGTYTEVEWHSLSEWEG